MPNKEDKRIQDKIDLRFKQSQIKNNTQNSNIINDKRFINELEKLRETVSSSSINKEIKEQNSVLTSMADTLLTSRKIMKDTAQINSKKKDETIKTIERIALENAKQEKKKEKELSLNEKKKEKAKIYKEEKEKKRQKQESDKKEKNFLKTFSNLADKISGLNKIDKEGKKIEVSSDDKARGYLLSSGTRDYTGYSGLIKSFNDSVKDRGKALLSPLLKINEFAKQKSANRAENKNQETNAKLFNINKGISNLVKINSGPATSIQKKINEKEDKNIKEEGLSNQQESNGKLFNINTDSASSTQKKINEKEDKNIKEERVSKNQETNAKLFNINKGISNLVKINKGLSNKNNENKDSSKIEVKKEKEEGVSNQQESNGKLFNINTVSTSSTQKKINEKEDKNIKEEGLSNQQESNDKLFSINKGISELIKINKGLSNKNNENKDSSKIEVKKEKEKGKALKLGLGPLFMAGGLISALLSGNWSPFIKGTLKTAGKITNIIAKIFNPKKFKDVAKETGEKIIEKKSLWSKVGSKISDTKLGKRVGSAIGGAKSKLGDIATGAKSKLGDIATGAKSKLGDAASATKSKLGDIASGTKSKLGDAASATKSKLGDFATGAKKLGVAALNKIPGIEKVKSLGAKMGEVVHFGMDKAGKKLNLGGYDGLAKKVGPKLMKKESRKMGQLLIPGLSTVAGGYFALDKFVRGDVTGGLIELAGAGADLGSLVAAAGGISSGLTPLLNGASNALAVTSIVRDISDAIHGVTYGPGISDKFKSRKNNKKQIGDSNLGLNPFKPKNIALDLPNKKDNLLLSHSDNKRKNNIISKAFEKYKFGKSKNLSLIPNNLLPNSNNLDFSGVKPDALNNLMGFAEDYKMNFPDAPNLFLNSAFRSYEDQVRLYKEYGPGRAAYPGTSHHGFGYAFDLNSVELNKADSIGLLSKWGFTRPYHGEAWHMEAKGFKDQPAQDTPKPAKSQIGDPNTFKRKNIKVNSSDFQFNTSYSSKTSEIVKVSLDKATLKSMLDGQALIAKNNKTNVVTNSDININGRL